MPTLDLNNTFGAFLIGTLVSSMLFGVTGIQTWYYFQNYSDHIFVQSVVLIILVAESLHIVFCIHATYHYTILNFSNLEELGVVVWSITATLLVTSTIVLVVQLFYARRIYVVSHKNVGLTALIGTLAVGKFAVGLGLSIRADEQPFFPDFVQLQAPWIYTASVLPALNDALIAASFSYYLHTSRSGLRSTDTLINKLIVFAINNGALTSVFDIIVVIFVTPTPPLAFDTFVKVVGNLYSNSMLATLNSRRSTAKSILPTALELSAPSGAYKGANGSITLARGSEGVDRKGSGNLGEGLAEMPVI
ncbi:hypothetical protein GALMADRAFT_144651 [Galerina marginata CBS 339.88]|uniref:DUF6534 domain-containing protein n=1 Tax=Galerina marginata (strain CBS 339.88) TaxID=685588 RepID=A0A067SHG1_GALM3|nr:hypothetical protein GALMADRAFT_144651 [Galerina marginata CBS 339.88]